MNEQYDWRTIALAVAALRFSTPTRWVLPMPTAEGWTLDWWDEDPDSVVLSVLEGSENSRCSTPTVALAAAAEALHLPPFPAIQGLVARGKLANDVINRIDVAAKAGDLGEIKRALYQYHLGLSSHFLKNFFKGEEAEPHARPCGAPTRVKGADQ